MKRTNVYKKSYMYICNWTIDPKHDSIRCYRLGKNWQNRVETLGYSDTYDPDKGTLII